MRRLTRLAAVLLMGAGFAGPGVASALAADPGADPGAEPGKDAAAQSPEDVVAERAISEIPGKSGVNVSPGTSGNAGALGSPLAPNLGSSADSRPEVRLDFGAADLPDAAGFLIFHDATPDQPGLNVGFAGDDRLIDDDRLDFSWRARSSATFTPRTGLADNTSSGFLSADEVGLLSSFTPRSANAHLSLTYAPGDDDRAHKRLGIELSSSIRVQPVQLPGGVSPSLAEALNRQEYNLGVNIGYMGFNLGASFRREYDRFSDGYEGFDIGLGYRGASWSTNLSVGEYRRRDDSLLGLASLPIDPVGSDVGQIGQSDAYYAFGFGASYNFSRAFSLSGGFRHFEYGRSYRVNLAGAERSQIFYLGTHLNF